MPGISCSAKPIHLRLLCCHSLNSLEGGNVIKLQNCRTAHWNIIYNLNLLEKNNHLLQTKI